MKGDNWSPAHTDEEYARAFQEYGVDVLGLGPQEAAARIRATSAAVPLAAALDDWAWVCRGARPKGDTTWKDLLATARIADPDERRNQVRDAVEANDLEALKNLASSGNADNLPPATLVLVGRKLMAGGAVEEASAFLRRAQRRHPDDFWINVELAFSLDPGDDADRWPETLPFFTAAVALRPHDPGALNNLGLVLDEKGSFDEAVDLFHEALRLKPEYAAAYEGLGDALKHKGSLKEAVAAYKEALRLKPDDAGVQKRLGEALCRMGALDEAVLAYNEAIRLKPDNAEAHYNLGTTLLNNGQLDEAVHELNEAIRLKKDYPEAHCNLGLVLMRKGQFPQAVDELRRGHELGSRDPQHWPYPSDQWLRDAEQLAQLDGRLAAVLEGKDQPKDIDERLGFAQLCQLYRRRYAAAARFYGEAFAAELNLAEDLSSDHRYNAACAAALAGCGQGNDAPAAEADRALLRSQALTWLRAELTAWKPGLSSQVPEKHTQAVQALRHWREDEDLAGVRDADALKKLPEGERAEWRKLWADVDALLPNTP
jgi:tetratricopeptide (TPR) repeat protein